MQMDESLLTLESTIDVLTHPRKHELQWLDISGRIQFCIAVTVHQSLNGLAPAHQIHRTDLAVICGRHIIINYLFHWLNCP